MSFTSWCKKGDINVPFIFRACLALYGIFWSVLAYECAKAGLYAEVMLCVGTTCACFAVRWLIGSIFDE